MSSIRRLYWDTSVFLSYLNAEEGARRNVCEDVLLNAHNGSVHIYTSTFTIAEVIYPKKAAISWSKKLTPEEVEKIRAMFRWPFVITIELDDRTANYAVDLARDHGLRPADAVHAASAILWDADVLNALGQRLYLSK